MSSPIVTVWGGGQLIGATSLPQFNATAGMLTRSIQISNNSDVALIYRAERGVDIVVSARYQLNAPLEANSQYSLSLASGQVGSATTGQLVTVSESEQEGTFSSEPIVTTGALSVSIVSTGPGYSLPTTDNVAQWGGVAVSAAESVQNNKALPIIAPKVAAIGYLLNAAGTSINMLRAPVGDGMSPDSGQIMVVPVWYDSANSNYVRPRGTTNGGMLSTPSPATLVIANASGANSSMTVTLPAAGAGIYQYITHLRISRTDATSGSVSGSGRLGISTTNLGGLGFGVGNEIPAGGTSIDVDWDLTHPLRSAVSNTASTFVLPAAGVGVWWEVSVLYYTDYDI